MILNIYLADIFSEFIMVYCVVFGCKLYKHVKGSGLSFHSFPAAGSRRKQWAHYCKCADFTDATFTSKLCSNHFSNKEQFAVNSETYAQYGYENTKVSLKEDAVSDIPIEVAP